MLQLVRRRWLVSQRRHATCLEAGQTARRPVHRQRSKTIAPQTVSPGRIQPRRHATSSAAVGTLPVSSHLVTRASTQSRQHRPASCRGNKPSQHRDCPCVLSSRPFTFVAACLSCDLCVIHIVLLRIGDGVSRHRHTVSDTRLRDTRHRQRSDAINQRFLSRVSGVRSTHAVTRQATSAVY